MDLPNMRTLIVEYLKTQQRPQPMSAIGQGVNVRPETLTRVLADMETAGMILREIGRDRVPVFSVLTEEISDTEVEAPPARDPTNPGKGSRLQHHIAAPPPPVEAPPPPPSVEAPPPPPPVEAPPPAAPEPPKRKRRSNSEIETENLVRSIQRMQRDSEILSRIREILREYDEE